MEQPENTHPAALKELCAQWAEHKRTETAAKKSREAVALQIVALVGKRDEGAQTHEADGFKVTVTGKQTRTMDWDQWEVVKAEIPAELHPVKLKKELDETGVKWLKENRADLYALLPIEIKPAATGVDVKVVL